MVLFTISPEYLHTLAKEAAPYDFNIQGYTSVQSAIDNVYKTNIQDFLGFCYVGNTVVTYWKELQEFLSLINRMCYATPKKVLFALKNITGLSKVLQDQDYPNLKICYLLEFDVLTDVIVNQKIFGSILLDNFEPYQLTPIEPEQHVVFEPNRLSWEPLFPEEVLACLEPVEPLGTFSNTKVHDKPLSGILREHRELYVIRENMIRGELGLSVDWKTLNSLLMPNDATQYSMLKALLLELERRYA